VSVERRRAALLCSRFLPFSETFIHEELAHHRRYEVHVLCGRRMNAERFPCERLVAAGPLFEFTRVSPAFDARLRSGEFSLIHAHHGPGGVYALPFARRHRLPLVVTFHGHDVPLMASGERLHPRHWPYAVLAPAVLREMTLGLCASNELLEMLREMGVPGERLRLHRLGVDLNRFASTARDERAEPLVAMIGRFVGKKGMAYGIRAFAAACRARAARLVVVGDGPLRASLERTAAEEGIAARVTFAGVQSYDQVAALLGRADVLLAPSVTTADGDRESGLLAVKEACAAGAVPVSTWHGGIPEIIDDGRSGFMVAERDVTGMAERLALLLDDPDLRRSMAAAARAKMEAEYDNRAVVAALEERYDEAVAAAERRG
jgi:colanic acid/amylovoran biosynthesis glycosyltransferase